MLKKKKAQRIYEIFLKNPQVSDETQNRVSFCVFI